MDHLGFLPRRLQSLEGVGRFVERDAGDWTTRTVAEGRYLYALWDDGDGALLMVRIDGVQTELAGAFATRPLCGPCCKPERRAPLWERGRSPTLTGSRR